MANQLYKGNKPLATFAPQIADNLTTDDSTKALSAKQGKVLNEKIDGKAENISFTIPSTYTTFDTFCIQLANEIKNLGISNKLLIIDATWTGHDNYYGEALWNGANYVSIFIYNNDEIYRIYVNVGSGSISTKKKVSFTAF